MADMLYKNLNIIRIKNLILLKTSFWYSAITKKNHIRALPFAASIEPLNFCNLHCPECPAGNGTLLRNKKLLDISDYQIIIDNLPATVTYLNLYFQGEPMLHPEFSQLVKMAHEKGIFTSTSTNGHFLDDSEKMKKTIEAGLNRLIISVDGTTQEMYEKYRKNGNLHKVIKGIENLIRLKKELNSNTPVIELQFLVMKHNEHQIPDVKKLGKLLGVDKVTMKSTQIYDFKNGSELIPNNEKYSRYKKKKDGQYYLKKKLRNHCWRQWSSVVITASGEVLPCCFDKNGDYSFGNILNEPFEKIWKNDKANAFRKKLLTNRKEIDICNNCVE